MAQRSRWSTGVAQVHGVRRAEVRRAHRGRPAQLAARSIGIDEVATADQQRATSICRPARSTGRDRTFTVQSNGQLMHAPTYRPLDRRLPQRQPGPARRSRQRLRRRRERQTASWFNGNARRSIWRIQRQPGTNTVEVVDAIKALLPDLQAQLPASVQLGDPQRPLAVRSATRSHDVKFTLLLTLALVVLVIFLFLRNLSATVIPSLALPVSIVGTFAVMYAARLQPRQPVADGAHALGRLRRRRRDRHAREHRPAHGDGRRRRCRRRSTGSKEIGFTIVSMTLSLAAVFIPVLFMGGIVGRLLHEFAVTIGASILVSGFVSLIAHADARAAASSSRRTRRTHGRLYNAVERIVRRVARASTSWTLRMTLRFTGRRRCWSRRRCSSATVYLFMIIPKGFIPNEDTGQISGHDRDARRASASTRWCSTSCRSCDIAAGRIRTSRRLDRAAAAAQRGRINIDLKPRDRADARPPTR